MAAMCPAAEMSIALRIRAVADARGCYLVDLWSMRFLRDLRAWSPDRLHLTAEEICIIPQPVSCELIDS